MMPEISNICTFLNTAKEIWYAVRQTYSKVRDAAQIFEIKTDIGQQARKSVNYGVFQPSAKLVVGDRPLSVYSDEVQ